ncbi:MAG TPA: hypothetical protein VN408_30160, partial [Actinoplanes sp.]|nr:hypothetical protein [Actinoplanes sp.]
SGSSLETLAVRPEERAGRTGRVVADDTAAAIADGPTGQVLVYGVAALVTRHQHIDDQELHRMVTEVLDAA